MDFPTFEAKRAPEQPPHRSSASVVPLAQLCGGASAPTAARARAPAALGGGGKGRATLTRGRFHAGEWSGAARAEPQPRVPHNQNPAAPPQRAVTRPGLLFVF